MAVGRNRSAAFPMSYDVYLVDAETGEVLEAEAPHFLRGGTYALGGTTELRLNITYNYSPHYYRVFGDKGIRAIYGLTAAESVPMIAHAISQLAGDVVGDYWQPTEGNARAALINLLALTNYAPHGVWRGD